jgi:hypothetical protein
MPYWLVQVGEVLAAVSGTAGLLVAGSGAAYDAEQPLLVSALRQ